MYAIVEVGAIQYLVKKDEVLDVARQSTEEGEECIFDKVLLVSKDKKLQVGTPYVKGASVSATIVRHLKGQKVISYKYRRRKSRDWKKGHRQQLSQIKIKEIQVS
ncbi:MAG: 50S ribosomal protein L21 [Candidatus Omnitrophica bacterium]|nr:50S ribosomal protein L21 [Candidatus Omnitrophota bacterium]